MFEAFLNPMNMAIGGALISSPILIHLINRMKFKRVRWAAMEFLLKSQKRNRRRLIIEQLILLLLRILLVLLVALLLARYLGASMGAGGQTTQHVILIDDSLSMSDHWKEGVETKNSFARGKQRVTEELLPAALRNTRGTQTVMIRKLSDPTVSFYDGKLHTNSHKEISDVLNGMTEASWLHLDMARGIDAVKSVFESASGDRRFLHIVSDFRQKKWNEPKGQAVLEQVQKLADGEGVGKNNYVYLLDAAHPYRRMDTGNDIPQYHDNLAIVEFQPEMKSVAKDNMYVRFRVGVANNSNAEARAVRVNIKINGTEKADFSVDFTGIPAHETKYETVRMNFVQPGFNQITAHLGDEEAGLKRDNVRFAVVDVQNEVKILVIDGDPANSRRSGGDFFHLEKVFPRGYRVVQGAISNLENDRLDDYLCIYFLNVPDLAANDGKALANLQKYIANGGGAAFFMGDKVKGDYYTKELYADGKGIFPAPLENRPTDQPSAEDLDYRMNEMFRQGVPQIYFRDPNHPIYRDIATEKSCMELFNYLMIARHWPIPRTLWKKEAGVVEELVTLPNDKGVGTYTDSVKALLSAMEQLSAYTDPNHENYRKSLDERRDRVLRALGDRSLYTLGETIKGLLGGGAAEKDANVSEFWSFPDAKVRDLRGKLELMAESIQYGDPLVVTKTYGKGRVLACMTTCGKRWNDWAAGSFAQHTYPVIMLEMQRWLSNSEGRSFTVGTVVPYEVDASTFDGTATLYYKPEVEGEGEKVGSTTGLRDPSTMTGKLEDGLYKFEISRVNKPGVYVVAAKPIDSGREPESTAFVFNVDTTNESDLRRASTGELRNMGKNVIVAGENPNFDLVINKQSDFSESPLIFLLFLLLLLAEQFMAMRLSYHLHLNEGQQTTPAPVGTAAAA